MDYLPTLVKYMVELPAFFVVVSEMAVWVLSDNCVFGTVAS